MIPYNHTRSSSTEDPLISEAARWFVRAQADLSVTERGALLRWLRADPEHVAAMDLVSRAWLGSAGMRRSVAAPTQFLRAQNSELAGLSEGQLPRLTRRLVPWVAVSAACAVTGMLALRAETTNATYRTHRGESLTVMLTDGSKLRLDSATTVTIHIGPFSRKARLQLGEAEFDVAHEVRRPFQVEARGVQVRDVGTQFTVRDRAGPLRVVVIEGKVELRGPFERRADGVVVSSGRQALADHDKVTLSSVDVASVLAWREGRIVVDDEALSDVVAEWCARMPVEVTLADPGLARLRVTGAYRLVDVAGFLNALSQIYPVRWQETGPDRYEVHPRS